MKQFNDTLRMIKSQCLQKSGIPAGMPDHFQYFPLSKTQINEL